LATLTSIIKYNSADTAGVVGQQPFKTKAKFNRINKWESIDRLNKIKQFSITVANDDYAQANMQIERSVFLPFLTPFNGVICGRSETPSIMEVDICEKAFHLTRRIFTNDGEKKLKYTDTDWFNPLWLHRREMIVPKTKVANTIKTFPLLINIPANLSFKNNALANGDDFVVTEKDGITTIPHEIDKYDSTTGELVLWLKSPKVSDVSNFEFYVYYDNPAASNQEDIINVWKGCYAIDGATVITSFDYAMIQHLQSSSTDSTENNNDGTDTSVTYVAGKIGSAAQFDATDSRINCQSGSTIDNVFDSTGWVSAWINPNSDGEASQGLIISKGDGSTVGWHVEVNSEAAGFMKIHFNHHFSSTHGEWETAAIIPINTWTKIDIVYNNTNVANNPEIFINGSAVSLTETSTPSGSAQTDAGSDLTIGNNVGQTATFDGEIEEVRVMKSPPAIYLTIIRTSYTMETDNSVAVILLDHEEYKKAANLMAQDVLDSANADMPAGVVWSLDQDFPTTVLTAAMPYKNNFEALHIIGEGLAMDIWFDNKSYVVFAGQKGRTINEPLDVTIISNPEINVDNFANEINVLGKRDDVTTKQISTNVTTATELRFNYESIVTNNQLIDVASLDNVANGLLNEFKKLTPQIKAEIDIPAFERNNLQSGDIIPIFKPAQQIKGNFRIMDIKATPQSVKLSLESTDTGVIRLRSISLTGVIEGILNKIKQQSIES
jgi:hypothetical protein